MVVLEHKTVGGKKYTDKKTWVEKVAEFGRGCWSDEDVAEVVGTMIKDGCHHGQDLKMSKC